MGGHTLADLVHPKAPLTPNSFKRGTNEFVMARVGWRWTINPRLLLDTRAAFLESPFTVRNVFLQNLQNEHYNEGVAGSTVIWSWRQNHVLEGGWTARRAFRSVHFTSYDDNDVAFQTRTGTASGWHNDAYVQKPQVFWVIGSTLVAECGSIAPVSLMFIQWRRKSRPPFESPPQLRYSSGPDDTLSSSFLFLRYCSISGDSNSVLRDKNSSKQRITTPPAWSTESEKPRGFGLRSSIARIIAISPA